MLVVNGQFKARFEDERVKNTQPDGQPDRDAIDGGGGVAEVNSDRKNESTTVTGQAGEEARRERSEENRIVDLDGKSKVKSSSGNSVEDPEERATLGTRTFIGHKIRKGNDEISREDDERTRWTREGLDRVKQMIFDKDRLEELENELADERRRKNTQ